MKKHFEKMSISQRLVWLYTLAAAAVLILLFLAFEYVERKEIDMYQRAEITSRFAIMEHIIEDKASRADWKDFKEQIQEFTPPSGGTIIRADSDDPFFKIDAPFDRDLSQTDRHHGFSRTKINGRNYRILSKVIAAKGERPEILLSLAWDTYIPEDDIRIIFLTTGLILLTGIISMGTLGRLIARNSLKPIERLSQAAEKINSRNLSLRLPDKDMPSELKSLAAGFNRVLERLEISHQRQDAFNSDVAHELRTPVGNMIGATEVALSRERSKEELEDVLQSNLEELERLSTIIKDMLFLSRADQGETATNLSRISLAEEVRRTADFLDVVFEDCQAKLEIEGDAETAADRSLLSRAITNLLNNAVVHGTPGQTIKVIINRRADGSSSLTVCNRGEDLSPEQCRNLFNRFYRVSRERKNSENHHGLGLAIVKAIILMHGGEVQAECRNGLIRIGFSLPSVPDGEKQT